MKEKSIMSPREVATRRRIYAEARDWYKQHNDPSKLLKDNKQREVTLGMCQAIKYVKDRNNRKKRRLDRKTFPEFFSFKPHKTWRKNISYWFTRYYTRGGYEKRVSILTALAEGKTCEQWYVEWKAAGNR